MKYTDSHEWILVENGEGAVGISSYAQKELGEVVYVELPKVGKEIEAGEEAVILESTKAASDIYSPVSGTITAINENVRENPSLINESPENEGWLFKISLKDPSELDTLLNHQQYVQKL